MLYVAAAMSLGKVRVVLHRPSSADNLGAAARVLKNFGLSRLAVVASPAWEGLPRDGGAGTAREAILARARRLARRASDLLEAAEIQPDLRAALGPATWVCGTTSRELPGRPRLSPRELAAELVRRSASGEVAVVFGEERRGLSDAELELCQAVCTIPTTAAYDSMNLAQAVAVVAYEVALAAGAASPAGGPAGEPARHATVEALWARLAAVLAASGYLNPQNPEAILAEWRRLLSRAEPTQREVELLLAAARALERRLKLDG
ncbi:MAG TPA: TrmH family RNA methyltransferase [Anaeromyxobacteraceae bacterium]|nr:TrmH family RNA methyltransferase [Anaeromyxobacteraceae bacterium]